MRVIRIPTKIACKITEIRNFNDWSYVVNIMAIHKPNYSDYLIVLTQRAERVDAFPA